MNCRRVEELIPLYAGGDLDRRPAREVQTHLERCNGCAKLAAEFKASANWLAEATPELDQTVLAEIKHGVMREIRTMKPRPGWFELITRALAATVSRPAVAAALLSIVIGALTFWVFVGRKASTPTEAKGPPDQIVEPERLPTVADNNDSPTALPKERLIGENDHPRVVRFSKSKRRMPRAIGNPQVATQLASSSHEAQPPSLLPVDADRMLRIEIQTGDPSIRIIWFAPEEVDSQQTKP
ncbi:MAG TPA: zf-HC2 domain-containing protein [Blastocatellia bacterium]|nr:zf-HC2 domain-containing protein [Blastocatellia bacterium]